MIPEICHDGASVCNCSQHTVSANVSNTATPETGKSEFDAFLYIVFVLLFYALSMVLLMIKYIKRENEEAEWDEIYVDFVKREQYSAPYQQIDRRTDTMLEYVKARLQVFYQARGMSGQGNVVYHETSV